MPTKSNSFHHYSGKVRDIYVKNQEILIVVSDRISAFDVILPRLIPYKGAVLNGISTFFLENTKHLVPNWWSKTPNSHVAIGQYAPTIPIEVIVRGYITGSMWRAYEKGERVFCGIQLPEGLKENQKLAAPIITPSTKASEGHDENSSEQEIIDNKILTRAEWNQIQDHAFSIFDFGSAYSQERNLILVDTKMEFGKNAQGDIVLIDEILTPDCSRYFERSNYQEKFEKGEAPDQLSKEFVRQWLIESGYMGRPDDVMPEFTDEVVETISNRYIDLYNRLIDPPFDKKNSQYNELQIKHLIDQFIQ